MLIRIIAYLWIIFGIWFLLRPESCRNVLKKKSYKKLRKIMFLAAIMLGALLIKVGWGIEGALAKIAVILGILAIIKGLFFLTSKMAEKLLNWWLALPRMYLRLWALAVIAFGVVLLNIR
ncbi:hypothetical protein ACFL1E_04795 [Candidatus Omnitrophota bacterium]